MDSWLLQEIRSGAQTGADQAGLCVGVTLGYRVGGMVPRGRRTEAGPLTDQQMALWNLQESRFAGYEHRTRYNVRVACGTVIFGDITESGSLLTKSIADALKKPCLVVPIGPAHTWSATAYGIRQWIVAERIQCLNVAGNRASKTPGIFDAVVAILTDALRRDG